MSRFDLVGFGKEDTYKRGVHLWAVLNGAPQIDWILQDPARPALAALYRQDKNWSVQAAPTVSGLRALEGWTLLRGVHTQLDHPSIVATFSGLGLTADAPHTVELRAAADLGEQVFTCFVDGEPSEALCSAAKAAPWPKGTGWELRQTYLMVPESRFPAHMHQAAPQRDDERIRGED